MIYLFGKSINKYIINFKIDNIFTSSKEEILKILRKKYTLGLF
jgi:hypothetical protein